MSDLKTKAAEAISKIQPYLSRIQIRTMAELARGEEGEFFLGKFVELAETIRTMPKTYEQDGLGDEAKAYLHYFSAGSDWWITERDMDGGIDQAFGYSVQNGDTDMAEMGYISIRELVANGVEIDLHFAPTTLTAIKGKLLDRTAVPGR